MKMAKTSLLFSIHQENTCKSCLYSNLITLTDVFTILQWIKRNFKISKFSRFLLRSECVIQVKIWKWLKLLHSVPFSKKTLVNHVYIVRKSSWLTFTVLQWMNTANPSKLVLREKTCFKKIFLILRKIILSRLQAK